MKALRSLLPLRCNALTHIRSLSGASAADPFAIKRFPGHPAALLPGIRSA
jgi:hypothetical protein